MDKKIDDILGALAADNNLRTLRSAAGSGSVIAYEGRRYVNLSSNDYLGLADDTELQNAFMESIADSGRFLLSNSSSRLITGNSRDYDELEELLSQMYGGRAALVLGNGYMANTGILPAVADKGSLIIADKLVHASLIDGLRLCECEWTRYRHHDMEHLESLLHKAQGRYSDIWVVTESVFSMDGDKAPMEELMKLKERYGFKLYLDEAHAFGVIGNTGAGLAAQMGMDTHVDVIIGTFGKAIASFGAFAVMSEPMKQLLVNRMRTLIFSTALPPINLMWTKFVVERLPAMEHRRIYLRKLIALLAPKNPEATHIIPLMTYDNGAAISLSEQLREAGFWVTPIRYPTVPKGGARIRISLSAALDMTEIDRFRKTWRRIGRQTARPTDL
jgi:8-amino-7-oxononanoate synthase